MPSIYTPPFGNSVRTSGDFRTGYDGKIGLPTTARNSERGKRTGEGIRRAVRPRIRGLGGSAVCPFIIDRIGGAVPVPTEVPADGRTDGGQVDDAEIVDDIEDNAYDKERRDDEQHTVIGRFLYVDRERLRGVLDGVYGLDRDLYRICAVFWERSRNYENSPRLLDLTVMLSRPTADCSGSGLHLFGEVDGERTAPFIPRVNIPRIRLLHY